MKKYSIELKWAMIFIAMSLIWMVLERLTGLHDKYIYLHPTYTNFMAVPAILVYFLALAEKRKKSYSGFMTFKQGLICGLIISLIVTIFSPLTQVITSYLITPHFFQNAINYSVEHHKMTIIAAEKYFSISNYIIQGLIGGAGMGIVTSALVALFMMKRKKN